MIGLLLALLAQTTVLPGKSPSPVRAAPPPLETQQPGSGSRAPFVNVRAAPYFAVGDGVADDTAKIQAAIDALGTSGGVVYLPPGVYRLASNLTVSTRATLRGAGSTDDAASGNRAATVLLKDFSGQGVVLTGDACGLSDLQVDSTAAKTGDGVQVKCSRTSLVNITTTNMGQDGVRVGADEGGAVTVNANLWRIDHLKSRGNGRHGLFVHHSNTSTTGTFPQGTPNVNAGVATNLDLGGNTGSGLDVKNAIDDRFYGLTGQSNTANCIHLEGDARRMEFYSSYCESNTAGDYLFDSGANFNLVWGTRFLTVAPSITDNGTGNAIFALEGDSSLFMFRKGVNISNRAGSGIAALSFYADANQGNSVNLNATQSVGTGGKLCIQTKRNGNTPQDRLCIDETGQAIFQNGALQISTVTQATLGTPANGTLYYCSDCTTASACTGGGTGALASRQNGAWKCL